MKFKFICLTLLLASIHSFGQCACCAGAGIGSSNGDYNNGILTLPKNKIVLEAYSDFRPIKNGNTPEGEERLLTKMQIHSLGIRYGVSNKMTLSVLLPYVNLFTKNGSDSGFGDIILLGTYNLYKTNNLNFAIQAGMELPTGVQKSSSFDNTTIIVGSGSYDPMGGFLFSKNWDKLSLSGNVLYKHTTSGFQNNYYGSLSVQNLSLTYKLKGDKSICSSDEKDKKPTSNIGITTFIGYSGEWLDKLKEDNIVDDDSGHYLGLANIGGNLIYKKWAFPITVSIPVISQMNGLQNDFGIRFRAGIIRAFN